MNGIASAETEAVQVTSFAQLKAAFAASGSYVLGNDISVTNSGITSNMTLDGNGHALTSTQTDGNSTIYQNENVSSVFKNVVINGNTKPEVGIWEGAGTMILTDCTVQNYSVSTVRRAAIGAGSSGSGKQGNLVLNNTKFINNGDYDVNISDSASVTVNKGTELLKLRLQSDTAKLNIGAGWSGSFEITMDSPKNGVIGTVGAGADVSGITVSNSEYYVINDNGQLRIKNDNGAVIDFYMNKQSKLHHGTTPYYKENKYAASGSVVAELGIGQNAAEGDRAEDSYIDFKLNAPEAGVYNLAIRYANDEPAPVMKKTDGSTYIHPYNIDLVERYAQIKVNDNEPETVYFRNTMSWGSFKTVDVQVQLNAVVEDVDGCGGAAVLKRETGKVSAEFNVKYNNTGSKVNAYLAEYDKDGALVQIKSTQLDSGTQSIDAEIKDSTHSYKAFLWDKDMKPLN